MPLGSTLTGHITIQQAPSQRALQSNIYITMSSSSSTDLKGKGKETQLTATVNAEEDDFDELDDVLE